MTQTNLQNLYYYFNNDFFITLTWIKYLLLFHFSAIFCLFPSFVRAERYRQDKYVIMENVLLRGPWEHINVQGLHSHSNLLCKGLQSYSMTILYKNPLNVL